MYICHLFIYTYLYKSIMRLCISLFWIRHCLIGYKVLENTSLYTLTNYHLFLQPCLLCQQTSHLHCALIMIKSHLPINFLFYQNGNLNWEKKPVTSCTSADPGKHLGPKLWDSSVLWQNYDNRIMADINKETSKQLDVSTEERMDG